jgi:antitoxin (DNA-binding transcriptional repressor) of toxin-antitoxin stability system
MKQISVADASGDLARLLREVADEHVPIEFTEGGHVVALLTPPPAVAECSIMMLQNLLRTLPSLGDDAEAFARDVTSVDAVIPPEISAWD